MKRTAPLRIAKVTCCSRFRLSALWRQVCTIEKANTLVNRLLEQGGLGQLSCIVVDELHMVSLCKRSLASLLINSQSQDRTSSTNAYSWPRRWP